MFYCALPPALCAGMAIGHKLVSPNYPHVLEHQIGRHIVVNKFPLGAKKPIPILAKPSDYLTKAKA